MENLLVFPEGSVVNLHQINDTNIDNFIWSWPWFFSVADVQFSIMSLRGCPVRVGWHICNGGWEAGAGQISQNERSGRTTVCSFSSHLHTRGQNCFHKHACVSYSQAPPPMTKRPILVSALLACIPDKIQDPCLNLQGKKQDYTNEFLTRLRKCRDVIADGNGSKKLASQFASDQFPTQLLFRAATDEETVQLRLRSTFPPVHQFFLTGTTDFEHEKAECVSGHTVLHGVRCQERRQQS